MIKSLCFLFSVFSASIYAVIPEKVLICGVCRDIASDGLPTSIEIVEHIGTLFDDYRVIMYENNSGDNTPGVLKQWEERNPKVLVKSEHLSDEGLAKIIINRNPNGQFFRPELIARARNSVLDIALSPQYEEFPYVIWMDMDFKIFPKFEGIIEVFESPREWDAVFAYGIAAPSSAHWDWYAFRDADSPIGPELMGMQWYREPKTFALSQHSDWYPVYSAFGGCGIYKKSSILGCRYSAIVTEDLEKVAKVIIDQGTSSSHPHILHYHRELASVSRLVQIDPPPADFLSYEDPNIGILIHGGPSPVVWRMNTFVYRYPSTCEHVPFHASMIANGHDKLFINPRLLFIYGVYPRRK
jgi:hypothetical protein